MVSWGCHHGNTDGCRISKQWVHKGEGKRGLLGIIQAVNICSNTGNTDGMLLNKVIVLSQHNNDALKPSNSQLKPRSKVKAVGV